MFFRVLIPLTVFFFFISKLVTGWGKLKMYAFSVDWVYLCISLAVLLSVIVFSGWLWKANLEMVSNKKLDFKTALQIHISSWLLRYIPGKVGVVLGKTYQGNKRWGISRRKLVLASMYEYVFLILSAFIIGGYSLYYTAFFNNNLSLILMVAVLVCLILVPVGFPKLFYIACNKLFRLFKQKDLVFPKSLSSPKLAIIIFSYLLNRSLFGFGFFLLAKSVTGFGFEMAVILASSFVLAAIIGFLAIFAPGGLGVREGVLVALLGSVMTLETAILLAILARVWQTAADGNLAIVLFAWKKLTHETS